MSRNPIPNIPELLKSGVKAGEPYACINMLLYRLSRGEYKKVLLLLYRLTPEQWNNAAEDFWYRELWLPRKDPEGALVCLLATIYGTCSFPEKEEMLEIAASHCPALIDLILPGYRTV